MAADQVGPQGQNPGDTDHQHDLHHHDQATRDPSGLGRRGGALADFLLADAVEYAERHWPVFPLYGKAPAIPTAHPAGVPSDCCVIPPTPPDPLPGKCKSECGRLGHGYYDATDDVDTVIGWWSGPYRGCNIGPQIPESMLVIDIDMRRGGDQSRPLIARYGPFPDCLTTFAGRGTAGVISTSGARRAGAHRSRQTQDAVAAYLKAEGRQCG